VSRLPSVSCLIAAYNFERFVARAVESALAQDYPPELLEVVVVDDGSTDGTARALQPYLGRVRYVHKRNGGLLTTVDRLLRESTGELLALLSGDDEWPPDRVRRGAGFLAEHPEVGLVHGDLELIDETGRVYERSYWKANGIEPAEGRVFGRLLESSVVSGGGMMFRSAFLADILPFPDEAPCEDWWIALCVARRAPVAALPGPPVYRYRLHGSNMSHGDGGERLSRRLLGETRLMRRMLAEVRPGEAMPGELVRALAKLEWIVREHAPAVGLRPDEVYRPGTGALAAAREAEAAGARSLAAGEAEAAACFFVRALALDPAAPAAGRGLRAALALRGGG